MARIRSLKPDTWRSRDMTSLSVLGRLVFVVLITQADDYGRQHTDAQHIARVHLSDLSLTPDIQSQLSQMERLGMIQRYKDGQGSQCLAILNFSSHQKISHRTDSRIQDPPVISGKLRRIREPSTQIDQIDKRDGLEGGITTTAAGGALVLASQVSTGEVEQVFNAWIVSTGKSARTLLDGKRRRVIRVALDSYPLTEVLLAIGGWRFSPHHRGENDRGMKYNELELLLRDAKHIEMFRDLSLSGEMAVIPIKPSVSRGYRQLADQMEAG